VSYKIIAKSLANIIKEHLPDLIHPSQSAFMQGRHIATIIIITQEIIHSFHLKNCTSRAFLLKVDLAKAFDRISWTFTSQVLKNTNSLIILCTSCMLVFQQLRCRCW
jgi:hypothetical protein